MDTTPTTDTDKDVHLLANQVVRLPEFFQHSRGISQWRLGDKTTALSVLAVYLNPLAEGIIPEPPM